MNAFNLLLIFSFGYFPRLAQKKLTNPINQIPFQRKSLQLLSKNQRHVELSIRVSTALSSVSLGKISKKIAQRHF